MALTLTMPTFAAPADADPLDAAAALVAAAREGDRGAFGQLYERYARMVHGVLVARVPREEAADLVHEVFLSALRKLAGLRDDRAFGGWLAALARHRAADYHRGAAPRAEELPEELPDEGQASQRVSAEAAQALAAIRRLPDAYRETLVLRLVEGLSGPEIAAQTGLTPDSVRVNLHRGMKLLRAELEKPR